MADPPHSSLRACLLLILAAYATTGWATVPRMVMRVGTGVPMDVGPRYLQQLPVAGIVGGALDLAGTAVQGGAAGPQQQRAAPAQQNTPETVPSDTLNPLLTEGQGGQQAGPPKIPFIAGRRLLQDLGAQLQNVVGSAVQSGLAGQPAVTSLPGMPSSSLVPKASAPVAAPTTAPVAAPATAPSSGGFSGKLSGNDVLALHNGYRAAHQNTNPLSYDTGLEAEARSWAQHLAADCAWYHSGPGENMASGFTSWSEVMWAFYKEYSDYSYANPGYAPATGHFTQLIWRETQRVGCAIATSSCWMGQIHVCHYSPVGNVNAPQYFKQNVYPPR